jgi:hypothetical protein
MQLPADIPSYLQIGCRRCSVAACFENASPTVPSTSPGHHGDQQTVADRAQRQRHCRMRGWEDAHRTRKHASTQRWAADLRPGDGAAAPRRKVGARDIPDPPTDAGVPHR